MAVEDVQGRNPFYGLSEHQKKMDANLSSMAKLYMHFREVGFAIISAHATSKSSADNKNAFKRLKEGVRAAGYGYLPLREYWIEIVEGAYYDVSGRALLVPDKPIEETDNELHDLSYTRSRHASIYAHPNTGGIFVLGRSGNVLTSFEDPRAEEYVRAYGLYAEDVDGDRRMEFGGWHQNSTKPSSKHEAKKLKEQGEILRPLMFLIK